MRSALVRASLTALAVASVGPPAAAQVPDGTVFFTEGFGGTPLSIGSAHLSGAGLFSVADDEAVNALGMAVDRERCHLYLPLHPSGAGTTIERFNLNGTGKTAILSSPGFSFQPSGVTLDETNGRLFWNALNGPVRIGSCNLDGSSPQALVEFDDMTPGVRPHSLDVDGVDGRMYWWDAAHQGFRGGDLDGTNLQDMLVTGPVRSADVDVVNGFFYWVVGPDVCRAPIDGSSAPAVIASDPDVPGEDLLAVDATLDLVVWMAGAEIHSTPISTPGVISESPPLAVQPWGSLELMPGPVPGFSVSPPVTSGGQTLTVEVCGGVPGTTFYIGAISIDGAPVLIPLAIGTLDASGTTSFQPTAPFGLSGKTFGFAAYVASPAGVYTQTLPQTVQFL